MNENAVEKILTNAEAMCQKSGARLTKKRRRALTLLVEAKSPISAYELIERYKARYAESLTAMSAYRMLNFLVEETLAHKLHSVNKYTVCEHINCDHPHELLQFLICDNCESVSEISVQKNTIQQLQQNLDDTGFILNDEQLELHGLCLGCQK